MTPWIGSALFLVALTAAIALHEGGHFVTARLFGMRADRFFVGFGPTAWSFRRGETEYGIKWILFGGFVRIAGMSYADERQRPVHEVVFDPDAVAADRKRAVDEHIPLEHAPAVPAAAGDRPAAGRVALEDVPAVPDGTWSRLDAELTRRGVRTEVRRALIEETQAGVRADATAREVADFFAQVASQRLPDAGKVGDVRHRVLLGDEGRFFHDRPAWQRAIVLSAGSASHFVQAIVLLFVAFWAFGAIQVPVVDQVLPASPAAEAGLSPGDRIAAVDGEAIGSFDEARELLSARPGEPVTLTVARDGVERTLELTTAIAVTTLAEDAALVDAGLLPGDRIVAVDGVPVDGIAHLERAAEGRGTVNLAVERDEMDAAGRIRSERLELQVPVQALGELGGSVRGLAGFVPAEEDLGLVAAARHTFVGEGGLVDMVQQTFSAMGLVFGPEGIGSIPRQLAGGDRELGESALASPLGLADLAGQGTAVAGLFFLLGMLAAINVFIGIFNIFPLPPLDGGHLAVLAVERGVNAVRARRGQPTDYRVDPRAITAIAVPVIVLLGFVFVSVLLLDIMNPLQLPQ